MKVKGVLALALAASLISSHADAQESAHARLTRVMDSVFGAGTWRITGGYRTPEREDQLRAQGARTVRPGGLSPHSLGTPDAPGAYDLVVNGMSPFEAAERLRMAGAPFARYMPKGAHGSQGPHLHVEPRSFDLGPGPDGPVFVQASYVRPRARLERAFDGGPLILIQEGVGRRRGETAEPEQPQATAAAPEPAEDDITVLRKAAARDNGQAQLRLARAYLSGELGRRDVRSGVKWLELAASNPKADAKTRDEATAALDELTTSLAGDFERRSLRVAKQDR